MPDLKDLDRHIRLGQLSWRQDFPRNWEKKCIKMNIFAGIIIGFNVLMFHAFTLIPALGTSSLRFPVLISS